MADYPEWVLKYKKKGTYINKVGNRYYLYTAHSVREKGTGKVKRVSDGYLGRITETEGFIPARDRVQTEPLILEYGLTAAVLSCSRSIYSGFKRSFKSNAPYILSASILTFQYGCFDGVLYAASYLSVLFPSLNMDRPPSKAQATAIKRGAAMLRDTLNQAWGDDYHSCLLYFPLVHMAIINKKQYLGSEPETGKQLRLKYNITWEAPSWLK